MSRLIPLLFLFASNMFAQLGYVGGLQVSSDGEIWVFDTDTNAVTGVVTYAGGVPNPPGFITLVQFSPDGTVAYVSDQSGHIYVVDPSTNQATQIVANTTGTPFQSIAAFAFTPDGKTVYAADQGARVIFVIDVATNTATSLVTLAGGVPAFQNLTFIATSPDGSLAYATDSSVPTVYVIDTSTNIATGVVSTMTVPSFTDPTWVDFSPNGMFAYVTDQGHSPGSVYVVNTSTHTTSSVVSEAVGLPTFIEPFSIVFSSDGATAYVADIGTQEVYLINTSMQEATQIINIGSFPAFQDPDQMAFSQNGDFLYITDEAQGLVYVVDTTLNEVVQLLTIPMGIPAMLTTEGVATQPLQLLPPTGISASQETNDFGLEYEICTILQWGASPSSPSEYRIFRNGVLIASVNGSTLQYQAHNSPKNGALVYSVAAVSASGAESSQINITIR